MSGEVGRALVADPEHQRRFEVIGLTRGGGDGIPVATRRADLLRLGEPCGRWMGRTWPSASCTQGHRLVVKLFASYLARKFDAAPLSDTKNVQTVQTARGGPPNPNKEIVMMTRALAVCVALAGAFPLAACGDDEDGGGGETKTTTITSLVVDNPDFDTLEAAVVAAGLADTLAGPGPFTVFAPTDAAFDALPAGTLDALLADTAALTEVLTYHVVAGRVDAATVVTLDSAVTLQGETITIAVVDGKVILNGTVEVVMTDIVADNGIIHVIDGVLLPPQP